MTFNLSENCVNIIPHSLHTAYIVVLTNKSYNSINSHYYCDCDVVSFGIFHISGSLLRKSLDKQGIYQPEQQSVTKHTGLSPR